MRRIAIVGSRHYPSKGPIESFVANLPTETTVISGGAVGVDTWAVDAAKSRELPVEIKHADWDRLGRKAGPIRNTEIVKAADEVVAFWNGKSRGTINTVIQAVAAGLPVRVFDLSGDQVPIKYVMAFAETRGVLQASRY